MKKTRRRAQGALRISPQEERWRIRGPYYAVLFLLIDIFAFALWRYRHPQEAFYVWYYGLRIVFVFVALVISKIRLSGKYYMTGIRELSAEAYWISIFILYAIPPFILFNRFLPVQFDIQYLLSYAGVSVLATLTGQLQIKAWLVPVREELQIRVNALVGRKKARLTNDELDSIREEYVKQGARLQQPPLLWRLLIPLGGLLLGAAISSLADTIVSPLTGR